MRRTINLQLMNHFKFCNRRDYIKESSFDFFSKKKDIFNGTFYTMNAIDLNGSRKES